MSTDGIQELLDRDFRNVGDWTKLSPLERLSLVKSVEASLVASGRDPKSVLWPLRLRFELWRIFLARVSERRPPLKSPNTWLERTAERDDEERAL